MNKLVQYNSETPKALLAPSNWALTGTEVRTPPNHGLSINNLSKLNIYLDESADCQTALRSFAAGEYHEVLNVNESLKYDGIPVFWGHTASRDLIHQCWDERVDFFHLAPAYLCASGAQVYRLTINNIQRNTIWDRPADRFHGIMHDIQMQLKPWRNRRGDALICPPDPATARFYQIDVDQWLDDTIKQLQNVSRKYKVWFEPLAGQASFVDELAVTNVVVTLNSNRAVESLFHGVPVISHSSAATAPLNIKYSQIGSIQTFDRTDWAKSLGYSQWTVEELHSGLALQHTVEEYQVYKNYRGFTQPSAGL